jgi:vacuolar-type H+-ATPase subunit D/Vma8
MPTPTMKYIDRSALTGRVEKLAETAEIVHEEVQDICQKAVEELNSASAWTLRD